MSQIFHVIQTAKIKYHLYGPFSQSMSTHLLSLTDRAVTNLMPGPMMPRCMAWAGLAGGETGLGRAQGAGPPAVEDVSAGVHLVVERTQRPHQTALANPRALTDPFVISSQRLITVDLQRDWPSVRNLKKLKFGISLKPNEKKQTTQSIGTHKYTLLIYTFLHCGLWEVMVT